MLAPILNLPIDHKLHIHCGGILIPRPNVVYKLVRTEIRPAVR